MLFAEFFTQASLSVPLLVMAIIMVALTVNTFWEGTSNLLASLQFTQMFSFIFPNDVMSSALEVTIGYCVFV